jgi:uncharacterized protein
MQLATAQQARQQQRNVHMARFFITITALLYCLSASFAQNLEPLSIITQEGTSHSFQVEVARNDQERSKGLMFRRDLPQDQGMLFDFERVQPVSMWMRNTYISLDMIFIRPDGTIARIAQNTEPLSTRIIPSGEPVLAVLELAAGSVEKRSIKAGDRVLHPLFKNR